MISFVAVILIKILKIIKNSPTISRDIVRNGVKIANKKKHPTKWKKIQKMMGKLSKYAKNPQGQTNM